MVSTQAKLALDAGLGGAGAATQHIVIKHFVDKPRGNAKLFATPSFLPGLAEYATLTDFAGAALALGYELYKGEIKHNREITDIDMAIITYGATALTEGVLNMFLDPPDILGSVNPVPVQNKVLNPNAQSIYGSYSQ